MVDFGAPGWSGGAPCGLNPQPTLRGGVPEGSPHPRDPTWVSPPDPNSFDTPEDVAEAFLASLTQTVEAAEANQTHGGDFGGVPGGFGGSCRGLRVIGGSHGAFWGRFPLTEPTGRSPGGRFWGILMRFRGSWKGLRVMRGPHGTFWGQFPLTEPTGRGSGGPVEIWGGPGGGGWGCPGKIWEVPGGFGGVW